MSGKNEHKYKLSNEERQREFARWCEYAETNKLRRIAIKNKWIKRGLKK